MNVFRIERKKYLNQVLSGIGASLSDGFRWNSLHTRLVYTSESRALALLEIAVHLDLSADLPTDRYLVEIEIPDTILIQTVDRFLLPVGWDSYPPQEITRLIGDDFVLFQESAILRVPSCIVPDEYNYLINPLHPETAKISTVKSYHLRIDKRLGGSLHLK